MGIAIPVRLVCDEPYCTESVDTHCGLTDEGHVDIGQVHGDGSDWLIERRYGERRVTCAPCIKRFQEQRASERRPRITKATP
jgi:hypothetical protein